MKRLLAAFCIFFTGVLFGQPFQPDITGHVNGDSFLNFCKKKQYTLIGTFDSLPGPKKAMAAQVVKNGTWLYIDLNGKEFTSYDDLAKHYGFYVEPRYEYYHDMDPDDNMMELPPIVYPVGYKPKFTGTFYANGKYGYKYQDKVIIQPEYDDVQRMDHIDNFLFFLVKKNDLSGICDYQGKLITPIIYSSIETLDQTSSQCFFIATKDNKKGILSRAGSVSVPINFDKIELMQNATNSFFIVKQKGLFGTISTSGKTIVPIIYESLETGNGLNVTSPGFLVKQNGLYGYVNFPGQLKVPCEYKRLFYNDGHFLTFHTETGNGALDTTGRKLMEPVYKNIERPGNANCFIVTITENGKNLIGILDLNGKTLEEPKYFQAVPFATYDKNNIIYLFTKDISNRETGFYNVKTLKWTLPCEYFVAMSGADYKVLWKVDPAHPEEFFQGVVDNTGQFIIPAIYKNLEFNWEEGIATASYTTEGKLGAVDLTNKTILPFKYDNLASISYVYHAQGDRNRIPKGYFIFSENGKKGLINKTGKITIPAIYDEIRSTSNGMICSVGQTTKIVSVEGKVYNTVNFMVNYRIDGLFEGTDSMRFTGIDRYGNKGIIPKKPEKRRFDPYEGPFPEPVDIENPIVDKLYHVAEVEEQPIFPGGQEVMIKFMKDNLQYPESAVEMDIQGRCYVSFVIERNGGISDVTIKKTLTGCPECDKEAIKLVKKMPNWIPAKLNGKAVRCEYFLPVTFRAD
jgi:TonB family protein